jgi:hypothetical protein
MRNRRPAGEKIDAEIDSREGFMETKPANSSRTSALINLLAGVLWIIAAFHPITGGTGIDYWYIALGIFFLVAGILGLYRARK